MLSSRRRSGRGAVAVVCETMPARLAEGVAYLRVADSSVALGRMASAFYGDPSRSLRLVGVTGTNGKTTTATLLYRLFRSLGYKVGLISTVTYCIDSERRESTHTTPDSVRLNRMMAEMVDRGCEYCFMEVSSHSLVQHRTEGLLSPGPCSRTSRTIIWTITIRSPSISARKKCCSTRWEKRRSL